MKRQPLVSILIPNYNYGHYLEYCLESVLNQTYKNIEVWFSDNASTDNSYEIAYEYRKKFAEKGIFFHINDNKRNVGSDKNSFIAARDAEGEYIYTLASDDAIKPTFIETCINIFEEYPNVGMVITNREEIDEKGNVNPLPPFYNTNCIVKGEDQAAVHMMAGIAIPGQRMVRKYVADTTRAHRRIWNVAGDWYDNFLYCMISDVAYVKESLCQYRVHSGNETNESELNLLGSFEHYQLINSFVDVAKSYGLKKPIERYGEAVKKLGQMCLRYALKMYKCKRPDVAERYLSLALVYDISIQEDIRYKKLKDIRRIEDEMQYQAKIAEFEQTYTLERTKSYDPPEGYILLK